MAAGLKVLFCIGEKSEEQPQWEQVLGRQLDLGLAGVDHSKIVIGYETGLEHRAGQDAGGQAVH